MLDVEEWRQEYFDQVKELTPIIEKAFEGYLVSYNGSSIHHCGSSSIKGMIGTGAIDLFIVTKDLLPDIP